MTRTERYTLRALAAESLGLLFTASYWGRVAEGKADREDADNMQSERVAAHADDWADFVAADKAIDCRFQAEKQVAA